jgi:hypothetical protein
MEIKFYKVSFLNQLFFKVSKTPLIPDHSKNFHCHFNNLIFIEVFDKY